jgi:hypothetical protein
VASHHWLPPRPSTSRFAQRYGSTLGDLVGDLILLVLFDWIAYLLPTVCAPLFGQPSPESCSVSRFTSPQHQLSLSARTSLDNNVCHPVGCLQAFELVLPSIPVTAHSCASCSRTQHIPRFDRYRSICVYTAPRVASAQLRFRPSDHQASHCSVLCTPALAQHHASRILPAATQASSASYKGSIPLVASTRPSASLYAT